ncbi:MAG: ABC transporter substrate-binding protein, partial [Clostridia bacterium]|nr:ABC transporter substrate-binding protein [Clostridia bacterium]
MKHFLITIVTLCLGACILLASCAGSAGYTVGICQQAPHQALDAAAQGFRDALEAELGKGSVAFLAQNAQGESTSCTSIINYFVSRNADLILASGTTALQAAVNGTGEIPILGTAVTDFGTALGMADFDGVTGINVSGTTDLTPLDQQAAMILELYPKAKKVGLLYCSAEPNSDYQIKGIRTHLEKAGVTCTDFAFFDSNE